MAKAIRSCLRRPNYLYIFVMIGLAYVGVYLFYRNSVLKLESTDMFISLDQCKTDLNHKLYVAGLERTVAGEKDSVKWEQFSSLLRTRRDRRITHVRSQPDAVIVCKSCHVFDLNAKDNVSFDCVPMQAPQPMKICVYTEDEDIYISKEIRVSGSWEASYVRSLQSWLERDSQLGLIDIGCNIGVYTLTAAALDRDVLAIDPYTDNLKRLRHALNLDKAAHRVMVLKNAVSDIRGEAKVIRHNTNKGAIVVRQGHSQNLQQPITSNISSDVIEVVEAILMNDLVRYCGFEKAVLKVDVESFEHRVFAHANALFDTVFIPVIMMEWAGMRALYWLPMDNPDRRLVESMIEFLLRMDYTPVAWTKSVLHIQMWDKWPTNILWLHKTFIF